MTSFVLAAKILRPGHRVEPDNRGKFVMPSRTRLGALVLIAAALTSCSSGSSTSANPSPSGAATASPTPPPVAAIVLTKGMPAKKAGCTDASCASMSATVTGLKASTTYAATCNADDAKEFYKYDVTTDASGGLTTTTCFYGFPGHTVWLVVGGIESNHLLWS